MSDEQLRDPDLVETIEKIFDPERYEEEVAERITRDLRLGIRPIPLPPANLNHNVEMKTCDYCNVPESSDFKLKECGRCHMVMYCSRDCQTKHWKEAHKAVCSNLSKEKDEEAKRIIEEMHYKPGDHTGTVIASLDTLGNDDAIFAMAASKHGLFSTVETLYKMEAAGEMEEVEQHLQAVTSWTQFLTTTLFKGDRANTERFYCICPYRSKEYIISSPTAWSCWMNASLYLARALQRPEFASAENRRDMRVAQKLALVHRSARDVLVSLNLALIHKSVAKAIFFGSKQGSFQRNPEEAKDYAMQICAKLQAMFHNDGDGFAGEEIDHNQTVEANVFHLAALLAYWYRELNVNPEDGEKFRKELKLDQHQNMMYDTLAVPLAEGSVELGRSLTPEELKVRSQAAVRRVTATSRTSSNNGGKGGKKNKNRRR